MSGPGLRGLLGQTLLTVVAGLVLVAAVVVVIDKANDAHWSLGLVATLFYAWAAWLGLCDLREPRGRLPMHKGLGIAWLTGFTGIAVAASLSTLLQQAGWARYQPAMAADDAYPLFLGYYVWVLLDMLPGLEATRLLTWQAPLAPANAAAGLPVIAFRAFVIFGLLAALRRWWQRRGASASAASTEDRAPSR